MDLSLLEALGSPPPGWVVPGASSPGWRQARAALRGRLRGAGVLAPVRTPRVLWQMCHPDDPPRAFTWGALTRHTALRDV
eukprot:3271578-Alexandrium_andersonii.AAC.1